MNRVTAVLVASASMAALAACSGSKHHPPTASAATVRTATCKDWTVATADQRLRLVNGMREFFGGHVDQPGAHGQVLPNARATQLFDAYCKQSFAGEFNLYRLYGNAAAFTVPLPTK